MHRYVASLFVIFALSVASSPQARDAEPSSPLRTRGIYVRQETAETRARLNHLINNSLQVGIDTLVVDLWAPSPRYDRAVRRVVSSGLRYVPRITMFPHGGHREQIIDRKYWEERWKLAEHAIRLGAESVQLDYIRYSSRTDPSPQNAIDIREVLRFFKERTNSRGAKLQIDVFGEVAHGPSLHIGQDMKLFAPEIDAVCPMVYPSHYEPYERHAQMPYETVYDSLTSLEREMGNTPVPVLAYIELSNHRFEMAVAERVQYIRAQLRAVREAKAAGWLAWSAGNHYDLLFEILRHFGDPTAS